MTKINEINRTGDRRRVYQVIHPLDDDIEQKVDTENAAPMVMTRTVRLCLFALRGYLLGMIALLGLRVLQLAGVVRG